MNDPRESQQWVSSGTLLADGDYTEAEMNKLLDDVLRRSARLLALTTDRAPVPGADPTQLFHRGWGRAALWALGLTRQKNLRPLSMPRGPCGRPQGNRRQSCARQ
ncbi:MAG: hypothetical protein JWR32_6622 [Mycobacterium sp.]|jgi:hypothetical protein|nr:hypothetical protein [Mycobacterium sp.]